jgi:hypothetical protein
MSIEALIDASIGRLRSHQRNEANGPEEREWAGSIADDLQRGLELLRLEKLPDSEIDCSDIPEQTDWSGAERGRFTRGPGPGFGDPACGWPGRSTGPMPLWEPHQISPGQWQAIRETGDGLTRYRHLDTAIDTLEGSYAERKAMIHGSRAACRSRCDVLNRRLQIGA